ncbi:MAG TPA: MltA domain-containing protein [Kaistiaceae bacterium]|nr:MltA domain-containing protein [Kaistiaceae bacterium]
MTAGARSGLALAALAIALALVIVVLAARRDGQEIVRPMAPSGLRLTPRPFETLQGWRTDALGEAFAAFARSCRRIAEVGPPKTRGLGIDGAALAEICRSAEALPAMPGDDAARNFFAAHFTPLEITPDGGPGFVTGYFEPELAGSRLPDPRYPVPLLARPDDLVDIRDANRPAGFDPTFAFARRSDAGLVEYFDRPAIEDGALSGRGLELAHVADPVDAFFVHVQGSTRIRLDDGETMRLTYAAKTGHPYTSIARILVQRLGITPAEMTADKLAAWLRANPAEGRALMRENRSYIFFREMTGLDPDLGPVAAAGVQITAGRSLAVDRTLHTFGTPVFLEGALPTGPGGALEPFDRLMIAQDTGSAIVGPARGDVFLGSGAEAGATAGLVRHPVRFTALVPNAVAAHLLAGESR